MKHSCTSKVTQPSLQVGNMSFQHGLNVNTWSTDRKGISGSPTTILWYIPNMESFKKQIHNTNNLLGYVNFLNTVIPGVIVRYLTGNEVVEKKHVPNNI